MYNRYYANVTEAVAISDREVEFRFDQKGNRELPQDHRRPGRAAEALVGRHRRHRARSATSPSRRWSRRSARAPTGSRASSPARKSSGRGSTDYWAANLPVKIGRENFDTRRYIYFQDDNAAWQAFTKGGFEDIRPENRSQRWATGYNFPAFEAGDVKKAEFPTHFGRADAGFRAQHAPAAVPGSPRAPGADLCLRFRKHEPYAVLRTLHAHRQLFRRRRTRVERPADRQGAGDPEPVQGQVAAGGLHRRSSSCRSTTRRRRRARTCARPSTFSSEAGWVNKGGKLVKARRPASSSGSSSSATTRPTSASPAPFIGQSAQARHRRLAAHRRHRRNMSIATAISTSMS